MGFKASYTFLGVDKITNVTKKISKAVADSTKKFDRLSKKVEKTGRVMMSTSRAFNSSLKSMAAGVIGFVGIQKFIDTGADFQDAIAGIEAITGEAGKRLEGFGDTAIELSKKWGFSASIIATAIKDIASQKGEIIPIAGEIERITDSALMLARAANIEVPDAIRAMVVSLNQWGVGAEKANDFTEILAIGQKIGASEIGQTAGALKNLGTTAAGFGISFAETNAVLQVLAKKGIVDTEAGTGLRGVLTKLLKASTEYGLNIDPTKVGIIGAFEELARLKLTESQMLTIFKEEGVKLGLALTPNVEMLKKFNEEMTGGKKDAYRQAMARMDTFRGRLSKLNAEFSGKVIKVFMKLEEDGSFTKIMNDLKIWIESIGPENLRGISDFFSGLLTILRAINIILKPIAAIFKGLGTGIGEAIASAQVGDLFNVTAGYGKAIYGEKARSDIYIGTSILDSFSIGGKFLGLYETEGQDIIRKARIKALTDKSIEKENYASIPAHILSGNIVDMFSASERFNRSLVGDQKISEAIKITEATQMSRIDRPFEAQENKIEVDIRLTGDTDKVSSVKTRSRNPRLPVKTNMVE